MNKPTNLVSLLGRALTCQRKMGSEGTGTFLSSRWNSTGSRPAPPLNPSRPPACVPPTCGARSPLCSPLTRNPFPPCSACPPWPWCAGRLAVLDQVHPSVPVPVWPDGRFEFDIDLEIGTLPADERPLQSRRQSTLSRENRKQSMSGHTWLDCLPSLQTLSDPSNVIFSGLPPGTLSTCLKRLCGTDSDTCT